MQFYLKFFQFKMFLYYSLCILSLLCVIKILFHRIPGSEWALQQAKRNVLEKYTLVGVTEQMGEYLQMLELVIPGGMFRNASVHFKHSMYAWSIFYSVFLLYEVYRTSHIYKAIQCTTCSYIF